MEMMTPASMMSGMIATVMTTAEEAYEGPPPATRLAGTVLAVDWIRWSRDEDSGDGVFWSEERGDGAKDAVGILSPAASVRETMCTIVVVLVVVVVLVYEESAIVPYDSDIKPIRFPSSCLLDSLAWREITCGPLFRSSAASMVSPQVGNPNNM